jgi:hypothetical protein
MISELVRNAAPMLEPVPARLRFCWPEVLARGVRRRGKGGHLCLVCGAAAVCAVICWPCDSGYPVPVWVDLCTQHAVALAAEAG